MSHTPRPPRRSAPGPDADRPRLDHRFGLLFGAGAPRVLAGPDAVWVVNRRVRDNDNAETYAELGAMFPESGGHGAFTANTRMAR